jgi:hypothetical protein
MRYKKISFKKISNQQAGSILVLTLVLLLFLQIVASSVIHSNHISHHVVSNFLLRSSLEKTANKVINDFIKNKDYFLNYSSNLDAGGQFSLSVPTELEGISATIVEFHCLDNVTHKKSYKCNLSSQIWHLEVMVSDKNKTVLLSVVQGLKLIKEKDSPASSAEVEIRVEKLWWYRR